MGVSGLVLAAGAGTRMGRPKALVHAPDGTSWLRRTVEVLRDAGCSEVTVVLGAQADQARDLVPDGVAVVVAEDWGEGQSASLRAGLGALTDASAVVITLVDLPDVSADVVRRVLAAGAECHTLSRAVYDGRPGHPVLLGRDHWVAVASVAAGDDGAKPYLRTHEVAGVECGDLATGRDQDTPENPDYPPNY